MTEQQAKHSHLHNHSLDDNQTIACDTCGWIVAVPALAPRQAAHCPRCKHRLTLRPSHVVQQRMAFAIAALIMLVISLSFPFMSFSVKGLSQTIYLSDAVLMLVQEQNVLLAALLFLTIIGLPCLYLVLVLYLYGQLIHRKRQLVDRFSLGRWRCCQLFLGLSHWLMMDVFVIGVLVSLVKIASLADVGLGNSFWAYCLFCLLILKCSAGVDPDWLKRQFASDIEVKALAEAKPLHGSERLQIAWALLICAMILYIPANLYPIMTTVSLGQAEASTILEGVVLLWHYGSYPIASVIFIASILIPLLKMLALAWLFIQVRKVQQISLKECRQRLKLYQVTEFIGRWSMIDIFVVAVLVALVQLQNLMAIYPEKAALCFAGVVISTMLSAMAFDPRLIWQSSREMETE